MVEPDHQSTTKYILSNLNTIFANMKEKGKSPLWKDLIASQDFLEGILDVPQNSLEKNSQLRKVTDYEVISDLQFALMFFAPKFHISKDERCSICCCEFMEDIQQMKIDDLLFPSKSKDEEIIKLAKCDNHYFHLGCILNYMNSHSKEHLRCPNCFLIYGILTGDQPPGKMTVNKINAKCSGFPNCDTIQISYSFPHGKLPCGKNYTGTSRAAYLPDNTEGREVLRLLQISFERKLTFTVGTSVTTGVKDTVVWNGVHHKTSLSGGSSCFGYPDATYFERVKQELANKGVS